MHHLVSLLFFLLPVFLSCGSKEPSVADAIHNPLTASAAKKDEKLPVFNFLEEVYDFGNVIQGEKVVYSFRFTNAGKANLIIASATASCGCIIAEYPKNPVPPGEERMVKVVFNTENRTGFQDKTITLVANTIPNTKTLKFIGNVLIPGK